MSVKSDMGTTENVFDQRYTRRDWWWITFSLVCIATAATRFYKVTEPDHVCWDETHFGKMASWYINRTFFFDVHPPLGKMLIALSGKLTGYDGKFPFDKPGDKYDGAKYEGMRIFCTTLGALIIPLTFLTIWEMTYSLDSTILGTVLLLCDVGFLTLNRYILLDPILLFFMSTSIYTTFKVSSLTVQGESASSVRMVTWQLALGTALSCTVSVKFVGVFVVLLTGLRTIADLWLVLGDLSQTVSITVKHLVVRSATLIVWPILLYVFFFWIHLTVLNKSGNGDGFYSSGFQARLEGNSLHSASAPRLLAYGAEITLKNHRTGGGYLHSHHHLYPAGVGARQQQITTYTHKDENNRWLIRPYDAAAAVRARDPVRHGDLVRLTHVTTGRNLHAHKERAPLSHKYMQVTGYGENGVGDANDVWKVLISGGREGDEIHTVTSKMVLVHYLQSCVLTTTGKQLPKWAFEQQEVACNPNLRDKSALWNVEDNELSGLPTVSFEEFASGFLERFLESHAVMLQGNAGLKPKEGETTSQPWQWPINYRGQFFSGSAHRVYLLGNPVVWWTNLAFLVIAAVLFLINAVRRERHGDEQSLGDEQQRRLEGAAWWLCVGWALHYVPFWAMGRVLYFHHYFPALVFSTMLTGVLTEYILRTLISRLAAPLAASVRHSVLGCTIGAAVYSFLRFSPLAYGMDGPLASEPNSSLADLRWLDTWEF